MKKTDVNQVPVPSRLCVEVTEEQIQALERLGKAQGYGTAEATLQYLIAGFTDGVRRPGSWERQACYQFFGDEWI
jgi:hypothetical protein